MGSKAVRKSVLEVISKLLKKVDDDQLYKVYPTLYDALVDRGLIKDIVLPVETVKPREELLQRSEKPLYPWETESKQGVNNEAV
jgi:hypothetical protein